jgi:hypothetical protein
MRYYPRLLGEEDFPTAAFYWPVLLFGPAVCCVIFCNADSVLLDFRTAWMD